MGTEVFLGMPPPHIKQWIINHYGPVVKETTVVKYTATSGLPDWEGDIVGELKSSSIPNMSDIAEVLIGSHVTSIVAGAFFNCSELISVTISGNTTDIGNNAFDGCIRLTSVTIPDSVTSIGYGAFWYCNSLTSVTFSGKDIVTVQGLENYSWNLPSGCVIHCTDGDITI